MPSRRRWSWGCAMPSTPICAVRRCLGRAQERQQAPRQHLHETLYNASLGVEWFPARNVGVVFACAASDIDLKRDLGGGSGSSTARLRVKLQGPSAFLRARF
jgi:hypothetical protein